MINLRIANGTLVVTGDLLKAWEHELFLTVVMGFETRGNYFAYPFAEDIHSVLGELSQYFKSQGLSYECDEKSTQLLQVVFNEQADFEAVKSNEKEIQELKLPSTFVRPLREFQKVGFSHLIAKKHAANFSVPGSGKTTVIYAAYSYLKNIGEVDKLLVIGPRSCFAPWEEEALGCFGKAILSKRLSGTKSARTSTYLQSEEYELFLCTYQTAANDVSELSQLLARHKFLMVVDESHNIKRIDDGVWASALLRLARFAKRRAILSGTPIPNSSLDLWTQFTFLWPGQQILGDKESFKHLVNDLKDTDTVRNAVKPFYFRVRKKELLLRDPEFVIHKFPLNPYQKKIYQALSSKFLQESEFTTEEKIHLRFWRKARLVRLIQTASNPSLLLHQSIEFDVPPLSGEDSSILELIEDYPKYEMPAKFEILVNLVNEQVAKGQKLVIWTTFIHNIKMINGLLKDFETYTIYGEVPKDENENLEFNREQQIREFKSSQTPAILIANPAACAESISLHKECHTAIYLDRTFNCGQYLQSLDRIHRIGLNKGTLVTYHILEAEASIDETITRRLSEKETNMFRILDDDYPIGTFETIDSTLSQSENEEIIDYDETLKDIKKQLTQPC